MSLSQYQFAKQFFISSAPSDSFIEWSSHSINTELTLYCHPRLVVHKSTKGKTRILCLGHIINPYTPKDSNEDIVNKLTNNFEGFLHFENAIKVLGGRWILIVLSTHGMRIYHDAAGLKSIFFTTHNGINIASQPELLKQIGATKKDENLIADFQKHKNSSSWPIGIVPYNNVKQLIPNHYLDLSKMEPTRYWPKLKKTSQSLESIAKELSKILSGSIDALTLRNNCSMSLTGGYDSRMLFSCVKTKAKKISYFTTLSDFTPDYDKNIPLNISDNFNLNHEFTKKTALSSEQKSIINILSINASNMFYDRSMGNVYAFANAIGDKTHLPGSVSEIARCYYYPYGKKILKHTGKRLAKYTGFKNNPHAEYGFQLWLDSLPSNLPIDVLDLLYWEHRLGVWGANGLTYKEGLFDQIPPMNNRLFMELSLTADYIDRLPPHKLTKKIIEINVPKLLDLPFNNDNDLLLYYKYPKIRLFKNKVSHLIKSKFSRVT